MTEVNSSSFYTKLESIEESLDGEVTKTFKRRCRQILLFNDSGSNDLRFRYSMTDDFATLKPTEFVSEEVAMKKIILSTSASVDFRLWVYG